MNATQKAIHTVKLCTAIERGDYVHVKLALEKGADPGSTIILNGVSTTLLEAAISKAPQRLAIVGIIAKAASAVVVSDAKNGVEWRIRTARESLRAGGAAGTIADLAAKKIADLEYVLATLESPLKSGQSKTKDKQHLQLFGELLFSEQFSDFKFVFPGEAPLFAHKNILAAVSPYFKLAFSGKWKNEKEVQPDHPLSVMKAVLSFIYTANMDSMEGLVDDKLLLDAALKAADYYQLASLMDHISDYMKKSLSLENLKASIVAAHLHGLSDLKAACFSLVRKNKDEALLADAATSIATISLEHPDLWQELVEELQPPARKRQRTCY